MVARVLIVDDDDRNRALIRAWLGATVEVHEAEHAAAAYAVLDAQPIDLVLLDVMMPGESGIDACRKIKERAGPYLPVLIVTALNDQEHRNAGLAAGADDFLSRPLNRQELCLRVALFLRLKQQEQQIQTQLRDLAKLNSLKDDLISLVAHDLRNPITGLFGWLHVLRSSVPDESKDDVDAALTAAKSIKDATDDLLQIKTLESGRLQAKRATVSADDLIRAAASSFAAMARDREVSLVTTTAGHALWGDATLLRRATENLVVNALKHAPRGSVVDVHTRRGVGTVSIEVADAGPGVPEQKKSAMFTKLGVLDPEVKQHRRVFGLGLYLVHLVAEVHGGHTGVRDREGGGAVFFITVPADPPS